MHKEIKGDLIQFAKDEQLVAKSISFFLHNDTFINLENQKLEIKHKLKICS